MMYHTKGLLLGLSVLLVACNTVEKQPIKEANVFDQLEQKVKQAQMAKQTSSPWGNAKGVNIELVGPIYQTGFEKKAAATKALSKVLSYIKQNPRQLDQMMKRPLKQQFSNIEVAEFVLGENDFSYIPAIFNVGYGDEAAMNAVFDVALSPTTQAQMGFYIDVNAWKNGIVNLQGYKTIKLKGADRNSTWFNYTLDVAGEGNKAKLDALLRMSLYAMGSDIREFASIDRDAVMKFNDKDYVVERGNGDTYAFVYQDRLKLIDNEIETKVDALDKERVISQTQGARSIYLDDSESYITVNTLNDYESKVALISLKNANQNTLLWESKQWDEYAKEAYFLPKLNTQVLLTDKFLTLTQGEKRTYTLANDNISSFNLLESRGQALFLQGDKAYTLHIKKALLKPLTRLEPSSLLAASQDGSHLYTYNLDKSLAYFNAKNQRLIKIHQALNIDGMTLCGQENNLVYWQGKRVSIYLNSQGKHQPLSMVQPLMDDIVSVRCSDYENKLLLMTADGEIRQFNTDTFEQIAQISGSYDAYDKLNSGHIIDYLANNEFIYGGKNDLKIRSSTTQAEIRADYDKRLVRINSARSWLDKSSIQQVVFAEPIIEEDVALYQNLFSKKLQVKEDKAAYLAFMNEEQADPLLVANKPSLFNALSGGVTVTEDGNIMLVKQAELAKEELYTTSIPNWQHLGFIVDNLYLGSEGFEPKVYRQLDNSQLTADITTMRLSDDGQWLVTALTNGDIRLESLNSEVSFNETFQVHDNEVTALALSSDLSLLATAGRDGLLKTWRLSLGELTEDENWITLDKELKGYAGQVLDLVMIDSQTLISSGTDQTIKLWDIKVKGALISEMLGHTDSVNFAKYDDSLSSIVSASDDNSIRIWDLNKREQITSFKASEGFVVAYDEATNNLAYSKDKTLLIKNIVSGNTLGTIQLESAPLGVALGFKAKVTYLVYEDRIGVYKVASGEHLNDIALEGIKGIKQVFTSMDSQDLYLVTDQEASIINMGRYALFGLDNVYK